MPCGGSDKVFNVEFKIREGLLIFQCMFMISSEEFRLRSLVSKQSWIENQVLKRLQKILVAI
jgi:hypothetical protein